MNTYKKNAITAGVLFIIGTVAGILSVVFTGSILGAPDYLIKISANQNQVIIGAFLLFIMGAACAGIAISLYPVLKKHNEGLALGAVGFRLIEGALGMVGATSLILLCTLSQEFVKAGAPASSYFQTIGALLLAGRDWLGNVPMSLVWCIGALMYYYIFYKTKLVPRWLSGWGIVGIILSIAASILLMFRITSAIDTIDSVLHAPIALQEMVMAVWLIVRGFNQSAINSDSAKKV